MKSPLSLLPAAFAALALAAAPARAEDPGTNAPAARPNKPDAARKSADPVLLPVQILHNRRKAAGARLVESDENAIFSQDR